MEKNTPKNNKNSSEISFSPITEGLGFHPFSDGLPYAPIAKTPTAKSPVPSAKQPSPTQQMGTGATVAGSPRIAQAIKGKPVRSEANIPQISVPVARPEVPTAYNPHPSLVSPTVEKKSTPQLQNHQISPSIPHVQENFGFVYLIKRVIAYWLDLAFSFSLCLGALSCMIWIQDLDISFMSHPSVLIVMSLFFVIFHWSLVMIQEVVFKSTIGKRIFGLALRGSGPVLFLRSVFFLPSIGILGFGLLWALFDRQKRCWHDRVVGTQPYEITRL